MSLELVSRGAASMSLPPSGRRGGWMAVPEIRRPRLGPSALGPNLLAGTILPVTDVVHSEPPHHLYLNLNIFTMPDTFLREFFRV